MVDFLLVLTERFGQLSRLRHYEQILVKIVVFERGGGSPTHLEYFMEKGRRQPTTVGVRKLGSLGYHVSLFA